MDLVVLSRECAVSQIRAAKKEAVASITSVAQTIKSNQTPQGIQHVAPQVKFFADSIVNPLLVAPRVRLIAVASAKTFVATRDRWCAMASAKFLLVA